MRNLFFPICTLERAMSENRFLVARDALGYGKQHRYAARLSLWLRDWAAEETIFPAEVAEMALAHAINNKVEAAYRRGHLLTKSAEIMEAWAAMPRRDCDFGFPFSSIDLVFSFLHHMIECPASSAVGITHQVRSNLLLHCRHG